MLDCKNIDPDDCYKYLKNHHPSDGGCKYLEECNVALAPTWHDEDEERMDIIGQNGNDGSAYEKQVGGSHYKEMGIQPLEFTHANYGYIGLKAAVHTKVNKYLGRKKSNEVEDIEKAIHCLEILLAAAKEDQNGKD